MVVNTQGMEIDSFTKSSGDKDGANDTGFPHAKTPKHCNKRNDRKLTRPLLDVVSYAMFRPQTHMSLSSAVLFATLEF